MGQRNKRLDRDINKFLEIYPAFILIEDPENHGSTVQGSLAVVDDLGQLWHKYQIKIRIGAMYPHTIPQVYEVSDFIERDWDSHVSKEGWCCLDIPHELDLLRTKGIDLIRFYQDKIYPFFANHQYRLHSTSYANGEYGHGDKGIFQYYAENFNLLIDQRTIEIIKWSLKRVKHGRNDRCPVCYNPKYKSCCLPVVEKLKRFSNERLTSDLRAFENELQKGVKPDTFHGNHRN
jgi:hypothetical protein